MSYPRFYMTHQEETETTLRAISVLTSGQGDLVSLALGDTIIDLSLADLDFIRRCVDALPPSLMQIAVSAEPVEIPEQDEQQDKDHEAKPKRHGLRWTKEEDRQMLEALQDGSSPKDIGQLLDRSPASIASRLLSFGVVSVDPKPDKIAELLAETKN